MPLPLALSPALPQPYPLVLHFYFALITAILLILESSGNMRVLYCQCHTSVVASGSAQTPLVIEV